MTDIKVSITKLNCGFYAASINNIERIIFYIDDNKEPFISSIIISVNIIEMAELLNAIDEYAEKL